MRKLFLFLMLMIPASVLAQYGPISGYCVQGASKSATSSLLSTNYLQGVVPQCTVTVYLTGTTTLATIYTTASGGTLTNPFQASISGQWIFYALNNNLYDVVLSDGFPPNTYVSPVVITGLGIGATGSNIFPGCTFVAGSFSCPQIGAIYVADAQTVTGCAQKINAAIIASGGFGTIQVGPNCGQTITTTVNPSGLPVAIQFVYAGTWAMSAPIITGANGGSVSGISNGEVAAPVVLQAVANYSGKCPADTAGTTYYSLICMQTGSSFHDISLDGNKANQSNNVQNILVQNADGVKIHNAEIQNASQDGIHITTTYYPAPTASETLSTGSIVFIYAAGLSAQLFKATTGGTGTSTYPGYPLIACTSTLGSTCTWGAITFTNVGPIFDGSSNNGWVGPNVLMRSNGRDGLFMERSGDWTLGANVQFEVSGRDGAHLEDSGTARFTLDDFGGNTRYGFYAATVNAECSSGVPAVGNFILSSQFGGNGSGDAVMNGSAASAYNFCTVPSAFQFAGASVFTGNEFVAPPAGGLTSVQLVDAGSNNIVGNTWGGPGPFGSQYNYLVSSSFSTLTGSARQPNSITKSVAAPLAGGPIYTESTPYSLTAGVDKADAVTSQGLETEWGNRTINGVLTINNSTGVNVINGQTEVNFSGGPDGFLINGYTVFAPPAATDPAWAITPFDNLSTTRAWFLTNAANTAEVAWMNDDGSADFLSLALGGGTAITNTNAVPQVGTAVVGQAVCFVSAGPPAVIGHCTSVVGSGGACTCVP